MAPAAFSSNPPLYSTFHLATTVGVALAIRYIGGVHIPQLNAAASPYLALPTKAVATYPDCGEGLFSIAASVKLRPGDYMLSPYCAPADDATRGSRFSSRSISPDW